MKHRRSDERAEALLERGLRIAVVVALVIVGIMIGSGVHAQAAGAVLNLSSARQYQTDEALYDNFTRGEGDQDQSHRTR